MDRDLSYEELQEIAVDIQSKTKIRPKIGIICGSGLGGLADDLDKDKPQDIVPYSVIKHFPACQVKGHKGNLVFGYIAAQPTVCMQGRYHFYEGHRSGTVTMPVRVLRLLGVDTLIVTNASGGLNPDFNLGDLMIVKDHINFVGMTGINPLIGPNEERLGPRFPAMTTAYHKDLQQLVYASAKDLGMSSFIREGVYACVSGPNYETPAEARLLRRLGADSVGMSTASEVLVAKHCGMDVLGISLITNKVIHEYESTQKPPTHEEVMDTSAKRAQDLQKLVKAIVKNIPPDGEGKQREN